MSGVSLTSELPTKIAVNDISSFCVTQNPISTAFKADLRQYISRSFLILADKTHSTSERSNSYRTSTTMPKPVYPLSEILPPLILGTATFNYQYNSNPHKLPATELVHHAMNDGIVAFDTSPYYGPSEEILGLALAAPDELTGRPFPRECYTLITKVGRIKGDVFDYSKEWVRTSVERSLERLKTNNLDLVYAHDVEFVSKEEVLEAVNELRRIRDEDGTIKYVGICGYPVEILCDVAEYILEETGEPLDAVQSYASFTLQSTRLQQGLERLKEAGVEVVPNASLLGMGLLRDNGIPIGGMGDWHPAPRGLREGCKKATWMLHSRGEDSERLEVVAMRWALDAWLDVGAEVGTKYCRLAPRVGVSVIAVSTVRELEDALQVWRNIEGKRDSGDEETIRMEKQALEKMAKEVRDVLVEWVDYEWASPEEGWTRKPHTE